MNTLPSRISPPSHRPVTVTFQQLSAPRQRLVRLMQQVRFGRVEGLVVRAGSPVLDPRPRIIREIKFGADNSPHLESAKMDFALKDQVLDMLAQLEELGDGVVGSLEIQHGLPFRMTVEEEVAA